MKKNILLLLALCLGLNSFTKIQMMENSDANIPGQISIATGKILKPSAVLICMSYVSYRSGYILGKSLRKLKVLLNSDSKLKKTLKVAGVTTLAFANLVGAFLIFDHFLKTSNCFPEWMKKHYTAGQLSDFAKKAALIVKNGTQEHVLTPLANMSKAGFAKTVQLAKTQAPKALDAIKSLSKKTCQRIAEYFKTKREIPNWVLIVPGLSLLHQSMQLILKGIRIPDQVKI
ncbi:hypothetical protein K9L05_04445 [Candidatus Babeliales bacterium]|nr:hypothetical protein [Candidatus Babeliales bacterium]MCF7899861.1 hypothetical protein [Candidatus Babeliales bacterium]